MQKEPGQAPRRALSATRVLKVLDFLAANPGDADSLSDLARGVDVNPSSLYSVLNVLEAGGYVSRDPRTKAYRLGFSAIATGHAALGQHPVVQRARDRTTELAQASGSNASPARSSARRW